MKKGLFFCILIYLLYGCTTEKQAVRYFDNNNTKAAVYCADKFPVLETTDTIEVFDSAAWKAYEDEFEYMATYIDSLLSIKCDTQTRRDIMYLVERIPSEPCPEKIITKQVESTAKYQVLLDSCAKTYSQYKADIESKEKNIFKLTSEVNEFKGKFHAAKDERNKLRWLILLLLGILFRKQILRGARKLITKI